MADPTAPGPAVSVVIPTYQRIATLRAAIDSVLAQTMGDVELIVVDDGSTDGTAEAVRSLAEPRLVLLRHETNRGAAAARNTGIAAARGGWVALLDSDDVWTPDKLARQLARLRAAPDPVGAATTDFVLSRNGGASRVARHQRPAPTWLDTLLDSCPVSPGTTLMARREVFATVGPLDETLRRFEDWDWLLRYLDHYELANVPELLAEVRVGGYARPDVVAAAAERLWALQAPRIARLRGRSGLRRFAASLRIERAVAHQARGEPTAAAGEVLRAALLSPGRTAAFARRLGRKVLAHDY